jgi:hypothetical protein
LDIKSSAFNPKGNDVTYNSINQALANDLIHPDDASVLISALQSSNNSAPLLKSTQVRDYKSAILKQITERSNYKSPDAADRARFLDTAFDDAFNKLVNTHYQNSNEKPSQQEISEFNKLAEEYIMQDIEAVRQQEQAHDDWMDEMSGAAKSSSDRQSAFSNDAEMDNIMDVFNTEQGALLQRQLDEDPMQIVPYINEAGETEEMAVWEILDMVTKGYGAFGVYYEASKDNWTLLGD